jgi:hypothetical protein
LTVVATFVVILPEKMKVGRPAPQVMVELAGATCAAALILAATIVGGGGIGVTTMTGPPWCCLVHFSW